MRSGRLLPRTSDVHPLQEAIRKVAALAADVRMKGLGGVKRPPFPTKESLQYVSQRFADTKKSTTFKGFTKPSNLVKPGPTISQVAPTPPIN